MNSFSRAKPNWLHVKPETTTKQKKQPFRVSVKHAMFSLVVQNYRTKRKYIYIYIDKVSACASRVGTPREVSGRCSARLGYFECVLWRHCSQEMHSNKACMKGKEIFKYAHITWVSQGIGQQRGAVPGKGWTSIRLAILDGRVYVGAASRRHTWRARAPKS